MRRASNRGWPNRVYTYGVRLATPSREQWPEAWEERARACQALWNALVAIFEKNSQEYQALLEGNENIAALQQRISTLKQESADAWKVYKRVRDAASKTTYTQIRKDLVLHQGLLRVAKKEYKDCIKPQTQELLAQLHHDISTTVKQSPLPWAERERIEQSFRNTLEQFLRGSQRPPHPRHFINRAHFCYRFSNSGIPVDKLYSGRLSAIHLHAHAEGEAHAKHSKSTGVFCSGEIRIPFQFTMHRPLPQGAIVKTVRLIGKETHRPGLIQLVKTGEWRNVPSRWEWTLQIQCEVPPEALMLHVHPVPTKRIALDLGYRLTRNHNIRFLVGYDGTGFRHEFLPWTMHAHQAYTFKEAWEYCRSLQADADVHIEKAKDALRQWSTYTYLASVQELFPHLDKMRIGGLRRIRALLEQDMHDHGVYHPAIEVLRHAENHYVRQNHIAQSIMQRLRRYRKWHYYNLAHTLCKQYRAVALEDIHLDRIAITKKREVPQRIAAAAKYRVLVSLSEFLHCLELTAEKYGTQIVKVRSEGTTLTCAECTGKILENDGDLRLECENGHVIPDQDQNAARIVWRRAFGMYAL